MVPDLITAIWFGLFIGFGELFIQAIRKYFFHLFLGVSLDIVWMAPLIDIFFIIIPAIILLLLSFRWSKLNNDRLVYWIFSFIGFLIILLYTPLHIIAIVLLAAGLSVWSAHFLKKHISGFQFIVRCTIGLMGALVMGLVLFVHGWQWVDRE